MLAERNRHNQRKCLMIFDIEGDNYEITHEHIVQAMEAFDRGDSPCIYKNFLINSNFTKAVEYDNGHL